MKLERKDLDALTAELTLIIEKDDYLPEYEKQLKAYQQKAQLKGFRKGKTPMGLIRKMYGTATMQESVSKILGEKINDIIGGDDMQIIGEPLYLDEGQAPVIDHTSPQDYSYRFEVGLEPEFDIKGADEKSKYIKRIIEISEDIVDEELEHAQKRLGEQKDVDDTIRDEDIVYIKIDDKSGFESEFSVSFDQMTKKAQKAFKGLKKGDSLKLDIYDLEEGMSEDDVIKYFLKLKKDDEDVVIPETRKFDSEITKVTRLEKAEINQELFDKYFGQGQVNSTEEAREKIKEFLSSHYETEAVNLLNREIMHNLVNSNKFDLPAEFLKKWISKEQEMPEDQFESFLEEMKWRIIKRKLVKKHDIQVEEKEILEHFVQMVRNYSPYIDETTLKNTVFSLMKNRQQVNNAIEAVSSGKLFDALREVVKIEEKKVSRDAFNDRVKEINKMAQ